MGKAKLVKRRDAVDQEQRQEVLATPTAGEGGIAGAITRAIVEYRRAKKENPRQAFFDLFQQQPSE
jgi:hypothetical protein